jgi:MerR family copper efflux transcriptional regulator
MVKGLTSRHPIEMQHMNTFTIGEVARRARVGIDTVRYYERHHLLPEAPRRLSGYREYQLDDIKRLRFIRRAKDLGFTLAEIRELLALSIDRERGVRGVKARAESRLAEVEQRIRELQQVRRGLKRLIAACPGQGPLDRCPILAALGEDAKS